ncbi:hypothetical protein ACFFX0_00255 [Citricoccus parietis]|uniref:Uncharacterized protein n=1 Tax=Citricoccus parietis TaxID=592307 RepID=A0ABV5FSR0_9MICC
MGVADAHRHAGPADRGHRSGAVVAGDPSSPGIGEAAGLPGTAADPGGGRPVAG